MVGNMDFNNLDNEDPVIDDEGVGADAPVDEDEEMHDSGNEDEDADIEEYSMLDKQLDSLNSVLDVLEHKNDQIHEQLKALLENSREIRINMAQENKQNEEKQG